MRIPCLIAVLVLSLLMTIPATAGDGVGIRRVGVHALAAGLGVSFSYRDVFTAPVRRRMNSGLTTRVVIQIAVEDEKSRAVQYYARTVSIAYDLWDENYAVALAEPSGKRHARVKTLDEAINAAGILWRTPVASRLPAGKYRLRVLAEINPVSEEMVRNIQSWISRPAGDPHGPAGQNYFGSFVGYFVDRRIGKAENEIRFLSQWFAQ
jgi:hypothetical protein